jgi:hypothetical protein
MNSIILNKVDMFERISRFDDDYPIIPANPRATALFTVVNTVITDLRAAESRYLLGRGERRGGVNVRKELATDLRETLKGIGRTARSLNRETHPGIAEQFRLPASRGYAALLGAAQSAIAVAPPIKAAFVELAMPEDFLDELEDLATAFAAAPGQKNDGFLTQVGGTAAMFLRAKDGVIAARELDAIVRNAFRNQPATLAIWTSARRIERAARPAATAGDGTTGGSSGGGTTTPPASGS